MVASDRNVGAVTALVDIGCGDENAAAWDAAAVVLATLDEPDGAERPWTSAFASAALDYSAEFAAVV